jgi:GT2 family glycosyltransferase
MESPGRVAVIICTRDRLELLAEALTGIRDSVRPGDEVVVVDSASRISGVGEVAEKAGFASKRVEEPGVSRARNAGAAVTSAPLLLFIDDDCIAQSDWVSAMANAFAADARLGFAFGRVLPETASGPSVSVYVDSTPRRFAASDDPMTMGHAANMAARREVFDAVGGFDEELGAGAPMRACEDKDFFWRCLRAGVHGGYVPSATVVHRQWRSRIAVARLRYSYGLGTAAFAAKAAEVDRQFGLRLRRRLIWDEGFRRVLPLFLHRRGLDALSAAARAAGGVVGSLRWRMRHAWR